MNSLERNGAPTQTLYEAVAERITSWIDQGTFGTGDRLPSVRHLHRQMRVSLSTVMEAYRLLEDRGIIEARPQSGHYVRACFADAPPEPRISRPAGAPTAVSTSELILMLLRNTQDPNLLQFGAALPNFALLPTNKLNRTLAAVARRAGAAGHAYAVPPGCEALRVQVARRLLAAGCTLAPEQIVITSGSMEAITLALRALCRPGDTVAVESPTYFSFLQAIETLGLRALELPSDPREGVCLAALEDAISRHSIRACLFILNFSNPLGALMPPEKKRALVALLAKHEIPLIEDDICSDLSYASERPCAGQSFDHKGLVLLCGSFSKTLSPGYRVGWIAPGRFQTEIEQLKLSSSIATATLPQLAVAEFLANGGYDRYLRGLRRTYARLTASMAQAVGKYFPAGTRVSRPGGGFVLWVECPAYVDALLLYEQALQAGVTLAPGPLFSAQGRYRNCIRLNAAYWSEEATGAIVTLGRLAAQMQP